jgi:hypothetical protein
MLPGAAPQDAFERLRALPFVERARDGLVVHDAVQRAIAAALHAGDPERHRALRLAAWRQLRSEVHQAARPDLWRYTADILYLLENPVVREAFFPSGVETLVVEPARTEDAAAVRAIIGQHEGRQAARAVEAWWTRLPESFRVVRSRGGSTAGFYCMAEAASVGPLLRREDPLTQAWQAYLDRDPVPRESRVLLLRRWLAEVHGESPSPAQAACWLDIKRIYMELRPSLRRVLTTVRDLPAYAPAVQKLGFRPVPEAAVELDGTRYHTAGLDFGPGSVDGWLADLVAGELGVERDPVLDVGERQLVIGDRRVALTPRECAVLGCLWRRAGRVLTRVDLLEEAWATAPAGGSNVVDVLIRSLRRKLGDRAAMIETVRGAGYRLRRD